MRGQYDLATLNVIFVAFFALFLVNSILNGSQFNELGWVNFLAKRAFDSAIEEIAVMGAIIILKLISERTN
jgi:hypothetical protein